jgi:hypothetical protein
MNHKAIYKLYPKVVSISGIDGAKDSEGNKVEIDMDAVNAWVDPEAYKEQRAKAYPTVTEQLDLMYHGGYDAWKAAIYAVKQEYPK